MRPLLLFLLLLPALATNAQQITQSFNEPVVGDKDISYRIDTSAYTSGLPLNITGPACVWDFTSLKGAFPMVTDAYIAPSSAPSSSLYPTATYAQHRDNPALYTFYRSSSSPGQTELLGGFSYTPALTLTFTNTAIIATYPVSYGYYLSDPVGGTGSYQSQNGVCIGNITISADGEGTLNLPKTSINNVLRLKSVETLTISSGIFPVGTFKQVIYNYYAPGKKFPVLNANYTTYQLFAGTPTITALVYGSSDYFTVAGIEERSADAQITISPNPFTGAFEISSVTGPVSDFKIYAADGRVVFSSFDGMSFVETAQLSAGLYFLETKVYGRPVRKKIVKAGN